MLEINLLPENLRAAKPEIKIGLSRLPIMRIAVFILAGLLLLQFLLGAAVRIERSRLSRAQEIYQALMPDKNRLDILKADRFRVLSGIEQVDQFACGGISWSVKMAQISKLINTGVWLTRLEIKEEIIQKSEPMIDPVTKRISQRIIKVPRRRLEIHGRAVSLAGDETALVSKFIKNLKGDQGFFQDFSDIELESIQRSRIKNVEVMDFKFACYFKDETAQTD